MGHEFPVYHFMIILYSLILIRLIILYGACVLGHHVTNAFGEGFWVLFFVFAGHVHRQEFHFHRRSRLRHSQPQEFQSKHDTVVTLYKYHIIISMSRTREFYIVS